MWQLSVGPARKEQKSPNLPLALLPKGCCSAKLGPSASFSPLFKGFFLPLSLLASLFLSGSPLPSSCKLLHQAWIRRRSHKWQRGAGSFQGNFLSPSLQPRAFPFPCSWNGCGALLVPIMPTGQQKGWGPSSPSLHPFRGGKPAVGREEPPLVGHK